MKSLLEQFRFCLIDSLYFTVWFLVLSCCKWSVGQRWRAGRCWTAALSRKEFDREDDEGLQPFDKIPTLSIEEEDPLRPAGRGGRGCGCSCSKGKWWGCNADGRWGDDGTNELEIIDEVVALLDAVDDDERFIAGGGGGVQVDDEDEQQPSGGDETMLTLLCREWDINDLMTADEEPLLVVLVTMADEEDELVVDGCCCWLLLLLLLLFAIDRQLAADMGTPPKWWWTLDRSAAIRESFKRGLRGPRSCWTATLQNKYIVNVILYDVTHQITRHLSSAQCIHNNNQKVCRSIGGWVQIITPWSFLFQK